MGKYKSVCGILAVTLFCCAVMGIVDGIIRPGYGVKSLIKIGMFLLLPILLSRMDRQIDLRSVLRFRKKGFGGALLLGLGIYGLIVGGYFLFSLFVDFSPITGALSDNAGVQKGNFIFVALYISFINSLLEEFFFRGFVFLNLKRFLSTGWAYGISAVSFALYHVSMMIGWFPFWVFMLVMAGLVIGGLIFDFLDDKQGTIYTSWLTHMFANFAINTIGFLLLV